jgi:hypothetical protein
MRSQGEFREFARILWEHSLDSAVITEYTILRRIPPDSNWESFTVTGSRTSAFESSAGLRPSPQSGQQIFYRIFATDGLERNGDTSGLCTLSLAPLANLIYPIDTLLSNRFEWSISDIANQYFTRALFFADTGDSAIWTYSTIPDYGNSNRTDIFSTSLPNPYYPILPVGKRSWIVRLEIFGQTREISYSVGNYYAPPY